MSHRVLVTGATGYVATRLIPALLGRGYEVRCLVRKPEKLRHRHWINDVEVVVGDVLDADSLRSALNGIDSAYYLIHNMASGKNYRANERESAINFGRIAREQLVNHIVFLGGLGGSSKNRHMQSRQETGRLLRDSGVAVSEFRTSVIIGSGSISFELIRFLSTWFLFIPAPKQTFQMGQPIGIRDLLDYLLWAIEDPSSRGQIFEIGGPEVATYPELMKKFSELKGISRPLLKLPLFPIPISANVADCLTPVPYDIAYPLMEELEAPSIVNEDRKIWEKFKQSQKMTIKESMAYALSRKEYPANRTWTSAIMSRRLLDRNQVSTTGDGFLIDYHEAKVQESMGNEFDRIQQQLSHQWQVDDYQADEWIRLCRSMKSLGTLYLEIQKKDRTITQSVLFDPSGIPGLLWWYVSHPWRIYSFKKLFANVIDSFGG